jgi:deoxyuridine 5'-triphosphate nucleotidohydrolase
MKKNPKCVILEGGMAPSKSTAGSAGWDVYARKQVTVASNSVKVVPVGIKVSCEEDEYFRIADRSGNASKRGMHVVAGVVDSDYRGEVMIAVYNTGKGVLIIEKGFKIAQMVLTKINNAEFDFVNKLNNTERGEKGGVNN